MDTDPTEALDRLKMPSPKNATQSNLGAQIWGSESPFRLEIKRLVDEYNAASEEKRAEGKRQRKQAAKRSSHAKGKASAELEPVRAVELQRERQRTERAARIRSIR
eukprot:3603143-Prymnesium_polylepis.2